MHAFLRKNGQFILSSKKNHSEAKILKRKTNMLIYEYIFNKNNKVKLLI